MIEWKVEPMEEAEDLWVTVFGVKVCISKGDEGISIDVWPKDDLDGESVAGTWVMYQELDDPDGE